MRLEDLKLLMEELVSKSVSMQIGFTPSEDTVKAFRFILSKLKKYLSKVEKRRCREYFDEINNNLKSIDFSKSKIHKLEKEIADLREYKEMFDSIKIVKEKETDTD